MQTKLCSQCRIEKPIDDFCFKDRKTNRRNSICRECSAKNYRLQRQLEGLPVKQSIIKIKKLRKQGLFCCPLCNETKKMEGNFYTNSSSNTGYASHCIPCQNILARELSQRPEQKNKLHKYYVKHKEGQKNRALLKKYNINLQEYNLLLKQQNGVCAICNSVDKDKSLAVDHNHKTGFVRGLLCGRCNPAVGFCKDSPELVMKLFEYLNKQNGKKQ